MWSGGWTNWRIWTIVYYPYWQLYGDLNLEELNGKISFPCYLYAYYIHCDLCDSQLCNLWQYRYHQLINEMLLQ